MPIRVRRSFTLALTAALTLSAAPCMASYVLFENGQVRPLAMSPDGNTLFAANTPDNRLEIFSAGIGGLTKTGSVEVGMGPVAVAARTNSEVWVVNHLSDSISIVDVGADPPRVTRTLLVGDEPRDIVFAGPTDVDGYFTRAFITTARRGQNLPGSVLPLLTTPSTPRALVFVFDATDLGNTLEGTPLTIVPLFGDTPRALAVSPDGATVYAAVFQSGNQTTAVSEGAVCNDGNLFNDIVQGPCTVALPAPFNVSMPGGLPNPERSSDGAPRPETGLIVQYDQGSGEWRDQLSRNWNNAVRFELPDFDVFKISANANPPVQNGIDDDQYAHVGTVLFNMVVNPMNGKVYVSNTDAHNEVRFEGPGILGGSTVRGHLHEARITVLDGSNVVPRPLNPHITYSVVPSPPGTADASLATPLGLAVNGAGTVLYVAAFGSEKIGVFDTTKLENGTFTTQPQDGVQHIPLAGGGPTGLVLDEPRNRLYVLTRFDNSVRVVNTTTLTEDTTLRRSLFSPESPSIVDGRPFLYDAALTSSNGEASCSSCHVFGDFDSLAWDLGNPDDVVLTSNNPILVAGLNPDFHPIKGPMTTQSLRGMANHGPMHWRGDRTGGLDEPSVQPDGGAYDEDLGFKKFNVAFPGLLGRNAQLSAAEMQAFTDFILQITYPPNPIRALDNVTLTFDQQAGHDLYFGRITDTVFNCNGCHVLDPAAGFFGTDGQTSFEAEPQMMKIPHLRNAYQKVGMFGMPAVPFFDDHDNTFMGRQVRGFGFLHDGSVDTLRRFHSATVFSITVLEQQQLEEFVLAFDSNMAPIVGQQTTLTNLNQGVGAVIGRLDLLDQRAAQDECDVVVKGTIGSEQRGWVRQADGNFRSDRASEPLESAADLRLLANVAGQELTYTCAPPGSGERMGIDRDEDGYFDRDELDAGSDPADPLAIPGGTTTAAVSTKKLLIKNKLPDDESKNKIVLLSKSSSITTPAPGSAGDPRCNTDPSGTVKATLTLASATSGQSYATDLPCQNWSLLGSTTNPKGYKYSDKELDDGTAKKVVWKNGKQLKASLFGKGPTTLAYDLQIDTPQGDVAVTFAGPSLEICMSCAGLPFKDGSDGKVFLGKDCPAPAACGP